MSLPDFGNIGAGDVSRQEAINILLASIAAEELGLAHIINAEGQKIEKAISSCGDIVKLLKIDESVSDTLKTIIKKEIILQFKLENVLELIKLSKHHHSPHID